MYNKVTQCFLPGQGLSPQTSLSFRGPLQSLPPKKGPMQLRVLFFIEPPHVTGQFVQVVHSVKSPSTEIVIIPKETREMSGSFILSSYIMIAKNLPGHSFVKHSWLSSSGPVQFRPPKYGPSQVRILDCVPTPQEPAQCDHSCQVFHIPFTI